MASSKGKDLRDFTLVDDVPIDLYHLRVGDHFVEDCYSDVYRVVEIRMVENEQVVFAHNLTRGRSSAWSYTESAYAPVVYRVKSK